jgi:hypothetical protein
MRNANDLIVEALSDNRDLRIQHLKDALSCLMNNDMRTGLLMLRNIVNATCGFSAIGKALDQKDPKSVMRMLSNTGNPTTENIFRIFKFLLEQENCYWELTDRSKSRRRA